MKPTRDTGWAPASTPGRPRAPTDGGKIAVAGDKRIDIRFDMLLPCVLDCELYGEAVVLARNVSAGGMLVQSPEVLPLGSVVTVRFRMADSDDEIAAQAEVKHHMCLNFSAPDDEPRAARAMGLRFIDFDTEIPLTLLTHRVLH